MKIKEYEFYRRRFLTAYLLLPENYRLGTLLGNEFKTYPYFDADCMREQLICDFWYN